MRKLNSAYDYMGDYDLYGPNSRDRFEYDDYNETEAEVDREDLKERVAQYVSDTIDDLLRAAEAKELNPDTIEHDVEGYNSDESYMSDTDTAEQRKLWDDAMDALTQYSESKLFDDDYYI